MVRAGLAQTELVAVHLVTVATQLPTVAQDAFPTATRKPNVVNMRKPQEQLARSTPAAVSTGSAVLLK